MPKTASADPAKPAATDGGSSSALAKEQEPKPVPREDAKSISVCVVPGIARYHAQECILIRFLAPEDLEVMTIDAATSGGYVPCKACKPNQAAAQPAAT